MKIPYTRNTKEVREFLEKENFFPLSSFQGKKYVYPNISTRANINRTWKERWYSTFDYPEEHTFLIPNDLDFEEFKNKVYEM